MPTIDGARLRDLRIRKGWSLETLAVRSGVSERAIRDLETGVTLEPRPNTVLWLAKALEVDPQGLWRQPATTVATLEERKARATVVVRDQCGEVMYRRTLYSTYFLIGRDAELNQVVLPHHQISLVHARVDLRDDGVEVRDCEAANGTFVNGERIKGSRKIGYGESITIEPFAIQVHRADVDAVPPATTLRRPRPF